MESQNVLLPNIGLGDELRKLLQEKLGIPSKATWFEVRFSQGEAVTVKCEFYPTEPA